MKTTTKKPSTKRKAKALNKHSVRHSYPKELEITTTEKGFTVWVKDRFNRDGKMIEVRHWVIDGSCVKEDFTVRFGIPNMYPTEARIDLEANHVQVITKR